MFSRVFEAIGCGGRRTIGMQHDFRVKSVTKHRTKNPLLSTIHHSEDVDLAKRERPSPPPAPGGGRGRDHTRFLLCERGEM